MINTMQELDVLSPTAVKPFKVAQAMMGLKMDDMDVPLLKYMDFFSRIIPVDAAYFLHVVPKLELFDSLFTKPTKKTSEEHELNKEKTNLFGAEIKSHIRSGSKMDIEYEVREGDRLEELLKDAKDVDADLLFIGKEGKKNNPVVLAKNLIRKVTCNTLVVPEKAKHTLKKILVPIDFSPHSIKALHTAIGIAKQLVKPAQVVCLNVYEMPNFASFNISKTREQFRHMIEEDRMAAFDAFLHTYAREEKDRIQKVLLQKEMPWIPHYITEYAGENDVDFIVMGAKGHSKVELLFMGSVTEKVLEQDYSIPVLVVKK